MANVKRRSSAIVFDEGTVDRSRQTIEASRYAREAAKEAVAKARALLERLKQQRQRVR